MGEWPAWHPTVSLRCHSTDVTNGFGSGTSRRCRARVLFGDVVAAPPAFLLAAPPVLRAPSGPPAVRATSFARRVGSKPGLALQARRRPPHWWRVVCVARYSTRPTSPSAFARLFAAPAINVACNSPATISNHEIVALGLQRFEALLNLRPIELHATFVWSGPVVCRETITCEYLHSAQSVCTAAP